MLGAYQNIKGRRKSWRLVSDDVDALLNAIAKAKRDFEHPKV